MGNVFEILNNYINRNSFKTYGDLLKENNNQNQFNNISKICNSEENDLLYKISNFDKQRLLSESQSHLKDNYLSNVIKKEVIIPGIGKVTHVC